MQKLGKFEGETKLIFYRIFFAPLPHPVQKTFPRHYLGKTVKIKLHSNFTSEK